MIDWIITEKETGKSKEYFDKYPGSSIKIWIICDNCGRGRWLIYRARDVLCFSCAQKMKADNYQKSLLIKPKFIKEEDRFIPNTTIDRILTIEKFGYDPADLKEKSSRLVCSTCKICGKKRIVIFNAYYDLCKSCAHIGLKIKMPKPKFILEKDRFLNNIRIDRIETIKQFNYDPIDLKENSIKRVIAKCQICGSLREVRFGAATDLCKSCALTGRIFTDETKQKISNSHKGKQKGKDNPNWQGGISGGKYCYKFNNQLKQSVRDRYDNCDYISGLHKSICSPNRELSVHHVNYDKQCGCDGSRCELIPLTNKNHMQTNFNRFFWNRLFIYSLEYDKTYYEVE